MEFPVTGHFLFALTRDTGIAEMVGFIDDNDIRILERPGDPIRPFSTPLQIGVTIGN